MRPHNTNGFFVAFDGPNGSGKSTLIATVNARMTAAGYNVYTTREPTETELGNFVRSFAESHSGLSLAHMVAADRYEHLQKVIIPELKRGALVITDRYVLSSLILQGMDGVGQEHILDLNSEAIRPDLQLAIFADERMLQQRLSEREILTRFERDSQSSKELEYMAKGITVLKVKIYVFAKLRITIILRLIQIR